MEYKLMDAKDGPSEVTAANDPLFRQFALPYSLANEPQTKMAGNWSICTSATAPDYSAVGYFFARELRQKLGVPVGIINSSWGGTDIETWVPPASLAANPDFAFVAADLQKYLDSAPELKAKYEAALAKDEAKAAEAKARGETYKIPSHQLPPINDGSPHVHKPSTVYNGKIHPLAPFTLAGIIWYQGEGGVDPNYRRLFPALITGLRARFAQGDLPFYWIQLPNWKFGKDWPAMREAQASALSLPATDQAITIDIGETSNIHPHNKQDVGHRLALPALHDSYGQEIAASGPRFAQATFSGSDATVTFSELGGGLTVKGDAFRGFELAGADQIFKPAEARIKGNTLIVHSAEVSKPIAVRYAWSSDPAATLFNQADLPAAPFRTDAWQSNALYEIHRLNPLMTPAQRYAQLQDNLAQGWNTWDTRSVLSHVHLPSGLAFRLGIKEYCCGRHLQEALIGCLEDEIEIVVPGPRTWDGGFTRLELTWRGIQVRVESATDEKDWVCRGALLGLIAIMEHEEKKGLFS